VEKVNPQVENVLYWFSRIYLGGIPATITDDSAFLSFICALTATEALAGYRYGDLDRPGARFKAFVTAYFPDPYVPHAEELWNLRNSIVHAFSTGRFALTHHHSERHFQTTKDGSVVLNAEDLYGAMLSAAQRLFSNVRTSPELQTRLLERLQSPRGGGISVGPVRFGEPDPAL
jgi:hypothetical protein